MTEQFAPMGAQRAPSASVLLAQAARAIHGERDLSRLLAWVTEAARLAAGADAGGVYVLRSSEPGSGWTTLGPRAKALAALGDLRRFPQLLPAVSGDDVVHLSDVDAHPELPSPLRSRAFHSLLAVPVLHGDGGSHGAIVLAAADHDPFDEAVEGAIVALAAHLGVALDNHAVLAQLAEVEAERREVVHQLQEAVRPPKPAVVGTELGVHYVASDPSAPTGGDLYDWVVLPNGDLHVAVVDIMGKGVGATKDALAVTHALRLLVFDGCPLDGLVARADAIVTAQNPDLVATLVVGHFTPSTGRLQIVGAGHPPPLLVHDGSVREIEAPGIPIGWPGAGSHGVATVELARSDSVVFYTDGLIETTKDIVAGLSALADVSVQTARYPAGHQARVLVERALENVARHDDSLALVLRRRNPPEGNGAILLGPFEYRFTPSAATVPLARNFLRDWLIRLPAPEPETDDLLLVATELCGNAVRHALGEPGSVCLRARAEGPNIVLEVENAGGDAAWPELRDEPPGPDAEAGRGLYLVDALTDEVTFEVHGGRTLVRCTRNCVLPEPA